MDIDGIIEMDYNDGVRAYRVDGCMVLHNSTGMQSFDELEPMSKTAMYFAKRWHALRAYQDEQRKKGEPIEWVGSEAEYRIINSWLGRDYSVGHVSFSFTVKHSLTPDMRHPNVLVWDTSQNDKVIAKFTNFRWRPGHGPKGGDHGQAG